jgi:hypothetical protein
MTEVEYFLHPWRAVRIYADYRTLDELGHVLEQLQAAAKAKSITIDQLNEAAGGNLVEYVREAIIDSSWVPPAVELAETGRRLTARLTHPAYSRAPTA